MNADLVAKIRNCPNLPSLPTIAMQVLELTSKVDVDIAEIARTISKDPALSTKILRTVNSSFYGRSQHVSTISTALVILGLQSVKTLVLGFSLVTTLNKSKNKGFKHIQYWRRSIFAATAARTIATKMKLVQQEEAFLASLLQDIGMLVLDQVLGAEYSQICETAETHPELIKAEQAALGLTHAEVGGMLAEQWKLPPILTATIGGSHGPEAITDPILRKLALLVQLAGWCADVFVDEHPAGAICQVRTFCASAYKMTETDCDQLLQEIAGKTKEVISLFEINVGATANYEAILKKANEALVELTLATQMEASQLQQQNQVLKRQASTDALTGLHNRGFFDQFLEESLAAALRDKKPLTLLMMDVDKFKSVNDKYGHPTGDQVLTAIGKIIKGTTREVDLAARYGGEEMAMILPGTSKVVGASIAESIRKAVAAHPIHCTEQDIPVTISIGVATLDINSPLTSSAHLLKAADLAVYAAKHGGRNCVKIFTMKAAA